MRKMISGFARFVAIVAFITLPLSAEPSANQSAKGDKMLVQMSFEINGRVESTQIELEDNPATRDFYALLPLILEFSDYVGSEKISPALPKRLNTSGPNGYDPQVGDLFYFSPWGNLGIFYKPADFHSGLVRFGNVGAGFLAKIKAQKNNFVIKLERVK